MDKRWIFAAAGAGVVAIGTGVWLYFKRRGENETSDEPQVNSPIEERKTASHIPLAKTSLDDFKEMLKNNGYINEYIGKENEYIDEKNEDKPEKVKVEENDPHICSEEDYVETYADYDHFTCTWYPSEKRLVNLDDEWSVMVPIRNYIGIGGEKILMGKEIWDEDFVMYAVDPLQERVYEILVNLETSYVEDMNNHILTAGGDD